MANVRTFYACQSVAAAGPSGSDGSLVAGGVASASAAVIDGVQSLGMTTNYNLEPIYQLGRISAGDQYENNPEVEVSITQAITDSPDLYSYVMGVGSLSETSDNRGELQLFIYSQTGDASGDSLTKTVIRPAYLSSATFNFPADGNSTADYTLVGNSKTITHGDTADRRPTENLTGIIRRNFINEGSSTFTNGNGLLGALPHNSKIQNVTISVDLGREEIYQLGQQLPFTRYINFPVEVSTEIEVIVASGDYASIVEATADCQTQRNIYNQPITVVTCAGGSETKVYDCGDKNRLTSVSQAGGDAGGDNATFTYSYLNYSEFGYQTDGTSTFSTQEMKQVDLDSYNSYSAFEDK
jgi:hypothetical protein